MSRAVRAYIFAFTFVLWGGVGVLAVTDGLPHLGRPALLAPLLGITVAIEALTVLKKDSGSDMFSFSGAAHIATAILFGPVVAGLLAACAVIVVDGLRLVPRMIILMNSAMFALAVAAGGYAFEATGGTPGSVTASDAVPLLVLLAVRFLVNETILAGAIAADGAPFKRTFVDNLRDSVGAGVGEGCLGVLIAFGYTSQSWLMLPFLTPLLVALYQAKLNFERLRRETTSALNAFAGVIDERDPSTAEHSVRVSEYVDRFAAAIDLPERERARLVEAARFHDLGKVAVDVSTLSRSGRLSEDELRSIRSHPRLSARLLAPFRFAQEIAVYAELHHERYDGRGYYAVSQREIPVEAHVLIVADSFDAMTSARAYRPALTEAEAVQELRDKAGTQFHPLVATAFAAMIEGEDVPTAIGRLQLSALRAEFATMRAFTMPRFNVGANAGSAAAILAAASLVALAPGVPRLVPGGLLALAGALGGYAVVSALIVSRRSRRAFAELDAGAPAAIALAAAGVECWAAWLEWDAEEHEYAVVHDGGPPCPADELEEVRKRAVRPGPSGRVGVFSSGTHVTLSAAEPPLPRLAVATTGPVRAWQRTLIDAVAGRSRPAAAPAGTVPLEVLDGDQREQAGTSPVIIVVELGAFEDVRLVAGQLSAERVVADASTRLQSMLRAEDALVRLGEDRFGVALFISSDDQLGAVCDRIAVTLGEVPVPRRARKVSASVRAVDAAEARSTPELAPLWASLERRRPSLRRSA